MEITNSPLRNTLQRVSSAESDAAQRINEANKRVNQTEMEADRALHQIQDEFERRSLNEKFKQEAELDSQRSKGYEQIRDIQRMQQQQINKLKRDGEADKAKLAEYYRNTVHDLEVKNKRALNELQSEQ